MNSNNLENFIWDENHTTELQKNKNPSDENNKWTTTGEMPKELENPTINDTTEIKKINKCIFCSNSFIPAKFHPYQKYCSPICKDKSRWPGNKKTTIKKCKYCNNEFVAGKHRYNVQMYCSVRCQEKYIRNKPEIKERRKKRHLDRMKNDIVYRLSYLLRTRLNKAIKGNYRTGSAVRDLGCSVSELKLHIESKFQEGMNWSNHGKWHIDHIKPLAAFNLADRKQLLEACHYTNLQPLWAKDNLIKSNKYIDISKKPDIV